MSQVRERNVVPKYEEIEPDNAYAFTFGPSDQLQFWSEEDRFEKFKTKMRNFLLPYTSFTYQYTIEISPHGRLHTHGVIKFKNKMDFYLYSVSKLETYGTVCIKQLTPDDKWAEYCTKQNLTEWIYHPIVNKPLKLKASKRSLKIT